MTITVWPVDAVAGAPAYSGRMLRQTLSVFLPMGDPSRPLGARSGVRAGTPASTGSATSTTWSCGSHAGVLDVEAAANAGPYAYAVDAAVSGALNAADASNARTDLVYAQLTDPAEDGGATPQVQILYLAGTPAGTPVAPATPARSMSLFWVNVPKVGGGNPTVTWVAPSLGGDGVIIPSSVVGGVLLPTGAVKYTGVTSVLLNGVFTSLFDNYMIIVNNTAKSQASNVAFQCSAAGTVDGNAAHYSAVRGYDHATSRVVDTTTTLAAVEVEAGTQGRTDITVNVYSPALPTATQLDARATANSYRADVAGLNSQATAWDGFRLSPNPGGTMTGIVRVYGYNN